MHVISTCTFQPQAACMKHPRVHIEIATRGYPASRIHARPHTERDFNSASLHNSAVFGQLKRFEKLLLIKLHDNGSK